MGTSGVALSMSDKDDTADSDPISLGTDGAEDDGTSNFVAWYRPEHSDLVVESVGSAVTKCGCHDSTRGYICLRTS